MDTLVANEEYELSVEDCREWLGKDGRLAFADRRVTQGQRIGQAWMNTLDFNDYEKLTGSFFDPFYADNWPAVIRALRFLLEN